MALVPGASSGGVFRRSREPQTLTDEAVDQGAVGAFRQIRDQEIAAQSQARAGASINPDAAARARRISSFTGQDPQSIIDRLPDFETGQRADKAAQMSGQDPVLRWWLADPMRSAASNDDLDTLAKANAQYQQLRQGNWFQRTFPGMFMSSTDWSAIQQHQISEAYAKAAVERRASAAAADGVLARAGAMWRQGLAGLESGLFQVGGALNEWSANHPLPWSSPESIAADRRNAAELRARAAATNDTQKVRGSTSWEDLKAQRSPGALGSFVLEQGIGSLPAMIGSAVAAPAVASSLAGQIGQNRANNDQRENADIADVLKAAPFAVASTLLDRFGLGEILHPVGSTLARKVAWAAAAEGGTEFAQNAIEYAGGSAGTKQGFNLATAIDQGLAGAIAGAGMGGSMHAMGHGIRTTVENGVRMAQARAGERLIGKVFANAEGSALRNRDPALFAEFLQAHAQGTAAENIFVPAEKLRELYQSSGWDWEDPADPHFGHFTPDFQEQMQAGLLSGGDVVIPMGKAAAYLAGTPEWEAIKGDTRVAPGSFSPNETAAMEEHWASAMDEIAQAAEAAMKADLEAASPRQAVHDAVFSMARQAGFSINAARAYGELWAERYQTRSERLGDGRTAMDLFGASVAGIRQALPGSLETYRRGDGLDVLVNAMRSGSREMKPEGQTLIDRIVEGGGVEDPGGDIKSMGGDRIVKGGIFGRKRKSLIRERPEGADLLGDTVGNSLTLDDWALRLWEEGYFPDKMERPSINDLLEAIGEGLADRHTYPDGGVSAAVETNNAIVAAADDLRNMLFNAGLDPETASRAEIEKAIAAYEAENGDRGYEQALPETIDVDGTERSTVNSDGRQLARTEEGVRNFWRWFGDSKVVDGQGRPLVVYHGTNQPFQAFARDRLGAATGAGHGASSAFFFTVNEAEAWDYALHAGSRVVANVEEHERAVEAARKETERLERAAQKNGDWDAYEAAMARWEELEISAMREDPEVGQRIISAYLRISNPAEKDFGGGNSLNSGHITSISEFGDFVKGAAKAGNDGIIARNINDSPKGGYVSDHYAVFDPMQIKSVDNSGAFDPADPRILYQGQDQGGARGRIDFLANGEAMITLFEGRDLSTLLHEGGHLWLEELRGDALAVGEGKLAKDWETVKAWFKREGIDVSDDGDIPTEAHELWARGMERYFMEGKAPSKALGSAFASFRAWLLRIYKLVTRLNSPIEDDVRRVMDRLIATDNAIAWAIHEAEEKALFDSAAAAGMSAQEYAAYRGLLEESRTEAYDQLLYKTMERIRRERTVAYQEERDRVRLEMAEEVKARPEFQALDLIRGNGEEYLPLDRRGVIERVGQDAISALPAGRPGKPTVRDGGADPDLVAERAGFGDGRLMLEALIGVQARHKELVAKGDGRSVLDEAIDVATERAMIERHADIFDSGSIEEEALEVIHSDAGAQRLAMEVRQLARKVSEVVQGEAIPAPLDVVNSWAQRVVREGRISDQASAAAVDRHRKAEAKAARAAERAYLAGDYDTAFREKQRQMMANALYRAARDAKNNVDVIARRLDRLARSRGYKGMDPEYLDRIHELLENYDLRRRTQSELRERESFDKWAKRQEEAGIEVFIPERLTLAGNVNFTKLKYEDLVALDDAVQSLAHLGREKSRLKLDKEERDFNEIVGEAQQAALALPMRKWSSDRNVEPSLAKRLDSELTKIEFLADQLDGGNPNGVFNRVLVQQATACANEKERLVRKVIDPLAKLYLDAPKAQQKRWAQRVSVPEFISINPETKEIVPTTFMRSELIAVALNIGNKSNLEKMLIGETMALPELQRDAHGWTEAKVMSVLNRELTQEDWRFVEAVWKNINELWPDIVRSERDITGVTPEKVEGRPVETPFGTIEGGYYPLVYDATRSQIAADNSADDAAKLFGQMGRAVATPKGHTISRTSAALPITFSLERVLFNHVNRVATRIAYGRYARDALKFIGDPRIRRIVDEHAGLEYHRQLKPWLHRQVNEAAMDTNTLSGVDRMLRQFRVNAQVVWMGFRVTTMISQLAGWNNSAAQIGPKYLLKGMKETVRNMGEIRNWVFEQSPEMAGRAQAWDRDVRTFYEDARRAGRREGKRLIDKAAKIDHALYLDRARAAAFWGIGMIDVYLVSMPTWVGAYHKGVDEGMTTDEARAYADKAVRESQGAGRAKDLAALQDGSEGYRILTLAYSYFSVQYNKQRETIHAARNGDWRRAAMNVFWIMMAAPVASAFLTGDWPDEEDRDVEGWVAWAMRKMFFGLWASLPGVRDVAARWERKLTGKYAGDIQAPIYEAFTQIERPIANVIALAKGEDASDRWVRDTITPLGYFFGLPTGQIGASAQYAHDVATGDQRPQGAGDVVKGIVKGPQKDQE